VPRRIHATIFALLLLVAVVADGVCLGAEPKKKLPPIPFPLLPVVQEWMATLDDLPSAGAAMDAERIYIPIQPERLVALNRSTGAKVWTREIESKWPPVIVADVLYVIASDEIHALEAATGVEKWRVGFDAVVSAPLTAAVGGQESGAGSLNDGLLIATFDKGRIVAYAADDGRTVWMGDLGVASRFAPAIDGVRAVFAVDDSRAIALRLADGRVEWEQKLDGMLNQPSFARDRIFIGSNTNFLFALDNATGRVVWKWKTGGDVVGTAADSKGGAYYASLDNVVRAVNRGNGNQRWIKEIPTRPALPPRVLGDGVTYEEIVVLTGVTSEIDAFATKSGAAAGVYKLPYEGAALQGEPLIDAELRPYQVAMVVITRDGRAIGLKSSAMLLPEPMNVPFAEFPGRRLERERYTPPAR
jgi:outer membrane protein assembly factor BamB